MIQKRMGEINARKAALRQMLEEDQNANLDEIEKELRELDKEREGLERRQRMAEGIGAGTASGASHIPNPAAPSEEETGEPAARDTALGSKEYRSAFAKKLMGRKLTEKEQRALDTTLTTTDTTYKAAAGDADGVNNGGLFVPSSISLALLEAISLVSPIYRDAGKTAIPGLLDFPYLKTHSEAGYTAEGKKTPSGSREWENLKLGASVIAETIPVTWKLEAMSVDGFLDYLTQELIELVRDKTVTEMIYGTGDEEMKGIAVVGPVTVEYQETALDGIGEALGKLTPKQKIGAKVYVSPSIVEEIAFTKDTNGNYIYSPINAAGVRSLATYPVETDPYLKTGEFVIGNMRRYLRINEVTATTITADRIGRELKTDYTAHQIIGSAAQPGQIVYGKKAAD